MIDPTVVDLLTNFGFPATIALALIYDRIQTQDKLSKVIEANTMALGRIDKALEHLERVV